MSDIITYPGVQFKKNNNMHNELKKSYLIQFKTEDITALTENINIDFNDQYIIIKVYENDLSIFTNDEWLEIKLLLDIIYDNSKYPKQNIEIEYKEDYNKAIKFLEINGFNKSFDDYEIHNMKGQQFYEFLYLETLKKPMSVNKFRKWVYNNYTDIFKYYVILEDVSEFLDNEFTQIYSS